ncbi:MAG: nucleotidyltransferase domain-containing protein [Spirochaetales bacterium]|nr:nucleotidyltransferase domain-containing protein [Spirochaetales bacterium]
MYSREYLLQKLSMYFNNLTQVKSCTIHGSLATGQYDEYSDIDLRLDVSGTDNGKFMLALPELLSSDFCIGF